MAKRILTLNIGTQTVTLAEYRGDKSGLELVNYGTGTLPAPVDTVDNAPLLTSVLEEISRDRGIKPGEVSVTIPGQMAYTKVSAIPAAGGADRFEQQVRLEVEQNVPNPEEMVCDRAVLGETASGETSVLITAAKIDQLEALCSAIAAAGFSPSSVDIAPVALANAVAALPSGEEGEEAGCTVMLDLGAKMSTLVIAEDEKFYVRSIPVAGNAINKEIVQAFECSPEEADQMKRELGYVALGGVVEDEDPSRDRISKICRAQMTRLSAEISRSINFYRGQQGGGVPRKLYLTGGTALLPQLGEFFTEALGVEVEFFNPFDVVGAGASLDQEALAVDGAMLANVTGSALRAAGAARCVINLLPPSVVTARADVARIPVVIGAAVALIAAGVAVMLAVNHLAAVSSATLESVQSKSQGIKSMDAKIKKAIGSVATATAKAEDIRVLMARRSEIVREIDTVRSALSEGMWIEKWETVENKPGDYRFVKVTIRGWADDMKAVVAKAKAKGVAVATASELVERSLRGAQNVRGDSVQIAEMTTLGKKSSLEQFVVTLKFNVAAVKSDKEEKSK